MVGQFFGFAGRAGAAEPGAVISDPQAASYERYSLTTQRKVTIENRAV